MIYRLRAKRCMNKRCIRLNVLDGLRGSIALSSRYDPFGQDRILKKAHRLP